jgi:carboxypeptidase C (cathepsin A)
MMGWKTVYDGLTYYKINGAGHMVPSDKPYAALFVFNEFLNS